MVKYLKMKKIIILFYTLLSFYSLFASNNKIDSIPNHLALKKVQFDDLVKKANADDADAMYNLSRAYWDGAYVPKDSIKAFDWMLKASENGSIKALSALSMYYKYGTPINYSVSYYLLDLAEKQGDKDGTFLKGYMHYKGLGCTQDYTIAVKLFKKSILLNNPGGMYFLGLCFRNGFGIPANIDSARFWLKRALDNHNILAFNELQSIKAEYDPSVLSTQNFSAAKVIANKLNIKIAEYKKNQASSFNTATAGKYTGYLVRYDWSGKKIVELNPMTFILQAVNDSIVKGKWIEHNRKDTILFDGVWRKKELIFKNTYCKRKDQYTQIPRWFYFDRANFATTQNTIYGNVHLYFPFLSEYYNPITIILDKVPGINTSKMQMTSIDETKDIKQYETPLAIEEDFEINLTAFPNPASSQINIIYAAPKSDKINLTIQSIDGKIIYSNVVANDNVAQNAISLPFDVPAGEYIISLVAGRKIKTFKIIKT
jgi:uncharacterized protein